MRSPWPGIKPATSCSAAERLTTALTRWVERIKISNKKMFVLFQNTRSHATKRLLYLWIKCAGLRLVGRAQSALVNKGVSLGELFTVPSGVYAVHEWLKEKYRGERARTLPKAIHALRKTPLCLSELLLVVGMSSEIPSQQAHTYTSIVYSAACYHQKTKKGVASGKPQCPFCF